MNKTPASDEMPKTNNWGKLIYGGIACCEYSVITACPAVGKPAAADCLLLSSFFLFALSLIKRFRPQKGSTIIENIFQKHKIC